MSKTRRDYGCSCGNRLGRKRVARLMAEDGVTGRVRRRKFKLLQQDKETMPAPIPRHRRFQPAKANQVWASDITYLRMNQGWLFLCVVLDLFSRKVVGWAMSKRQDSVLVSKTFNMPLTNRGMPSKLMNYSDQGCQFISRDFRDLLQVNAIPCSMSRRGNC